MIYHTNIDIFYHAIIHFTLHNLIFNNLCEKY